MAKKGNYLCPNCGKDCGNPPALNLHKAYCKGKDPTKEEGTKCSHEFRLLNPKNAAERSALEDGFINLCTKCKEIE